jgi:hydroxymethylpyrimidine/phosphomethylpyrimidine kinase
VTVRQVRVLVVAGLDPSGRAGLLADVSAIRNLGALPLAAASALTAQGAHTFAMDPVSPRMVSRQLEALLELGPVHAVKLGMIPSRASLRAVKDALRPLRAPWVVDPVVRTSKGELLSRLTPRDFRALAAQTVVLTPNAPEAAWLLGRRRGLARLDEAVSAAKRLQQWGFGAVVLKGGHLRGPPTDIVAVEGGETVIEGQRAPRTPEHRGTGCRFASSIAVFLAQGDPFVEAILGAKRQIDGYLRAIIAMR